MNIKYKLILQFFISLRIVRSFQASNIVYLGESSRGQQISNDLPYYKDNPQTIPLSQFNLSATDPSFTITFKLDTWVSQTYSNILQIYNINNPDQKLLMVAYQPSASTNQNDAVYLRQQNGANSYQGMITCNAFNLNDGQQAFIVSAKRSSIPYSQIDFHLSIMNLSGTATCDKTSNFKINLLNWDPSQYVVQFSNSAPAGTSKKEYSFFGTMYKIYLFNNVYTGNLSSDLKRFVFTMVPYSHEVFSYLRFDKPLTGDQICIKDYSSTKNRCAISASDSSYPNLLTDYAQFKTGSYFKQYFYLDYYFNYIDEYVTSTESTWSFWFYIKDTIPNLKSKIFTLTALDGTYKFRVEIAYKAATLPQPSGYQLFVYDLSGASVTGPMLLYSNNYYHISICFSRFTAYTLDIIINYQGAFTKKTQAFGPISLQSSPSFLQVGDPLNNLSTTYFQISQFRMFNSAQWIIDIPQANIIIVGCEMVIYSRGNYQCLVCNQSFYLQDNSCVNNCSTGFTKNQNLRTCSKSCYYRCDTCDSTDSTKCLTCSSNTRDISTNCQCKSGYEDGQSADCYLYKKGTLGYEISYSQYTLSEVAQTQKFQFINPFRTKPKAIFSLIGFSNSVSLFKVTSIDNPIITNTDITATMRGSYNAVTDKTPTNPTSVKYLMFAYESDSTQFYSNTFNMQFTNSGQFYQNIEIGQYNQGLYGNYKVLTFVSGFKIKKASTTDDQVLLNYQISVSSDQKQIIISVSSQIKFLQISYLVLPDSMPILQEKVTYSSTSPNGFYTDPLQMFRMKTDIHNVPINHASMQNSDNSLGYQSFFGINQLDSLAYDIFQFNYQYNLKTAANSQDTYFHIHAKNMNSYTQNGFYLAEYLTPGPCSARDQSGQCISCGNLLNVYPQNDCVGCSFNRILQGYKCVCPDPNFIKVYLDDSRCSYDDTAVLDITLSEKFDLITIDFGLNIDIVNYTIQSQPTFELCKYIFQQQTLDLIKESASCITSGMIIKIYLESDAIISKGDIILFNQKIKFVGYTTNIINFFRNTVNQPELTYQPDVLISYPQSPSICIPFSIQVQSFINDQKRGIKSFIWIFDSITPQDANIQNLVQQVIDKANSDKNLLLYFNKNIFQPQMQLQLRLQYSYNIGMSAEKVILITPQKVPILSASSLQLKTGPYYRKDSLEIFVEISYTQCNEKGEIETISSAVFDISIAQQQLNYQQQLTDFQHKAFSFKVDPYTTQANQIYIFYVYIQSKTNLNDVYQLDHQVSINQVPLIAFVDGGNRLSDYNQILNISSISKDLDLDSPDKTVGISISWSCLDLSLQQPCQDIENKLIPIPQTQNITFAENTFIPYSIVQFTFTASKDTRFQKTAITIQFTDESIPPLFVRFDDDLLLQPKINLNQIIEAELIYDSTEDVNNLFFASAFIYQKKVKNVYTFEYLTVRFQTWSHLATYSVLNDQIAFRFSVYNPKYSIPSQAVYLFTINFPPQQCQLSITPATGFTLQTQFTIQMSNCVDEDSPIMYKYFYYNKQQYFTEEKANPLLIQRRQLSDQTYDNQIQTFLPEGDIFVLVQAIDSRNAIFNITQTITVKQQQMDQTSYVQLVNQIISLASTQTTQQQSLILSLLSEDMINRPLFYNFLTTQAKAILDSLQSLSLSTIQQSTFTNLSAQTISLLLKSQLIVQDKNMITENFKTISNILDLATQALTTDVQFMKDKYNEQLYNCFKILDSIGQNAQVDKLLEQNSIQLSEKIGDLLNVDSFPNEDAKKFKGDFYKVVSQLVTRKKINSYLGTETIANWQNFDEQEIQDPTLNQVYQVAFKSYKNNLYKNEDSYLSFIQDVLKNQPTIKINDYQAINPSIKLYQNQKKSRLLVENIQLNDQIIHTFAPIKNETLTCLNKANNQWTTQGCKSIYNDKQKAYNCICNQLNPVTVINDISKVFQNENINTVFSDQGLKNIEDFNNFYKYFAFWVLASITLATLYFVIYGHFLDQNSKINKARQSKIVPHINIQSIYQNIEKKKDDDNLSVQISNEDRKNSNFYTPSIQGFEKKSPITITSMNDIAKPEKQPQRIKSKFLFQKEIQHAFQQKMPYITTSKHTIKTENDQSPFIGQNTLSIGEVQAKQKIQSKSLNCIEAPGEKRQEKIQNPDSSQTIISKKSVNEKPLKKQKTLQVNKDKAQKFESISKFKQLMFFHNFFSIFLVYDPELSRGIRFIIFYAKNLHLFTFNIIFNQNYSIVQVAFLNLLNLVIATLIAQTVEVGYQSNRLLKRFSQFFILCVVGFYYYAFLAVVSDKDPSATNYTSLAFFIVLLGDILVTSMIISFIFQHVAKKLLRNEEVLGLKLKIFEFLKIQLILQSLLR